VTRRKAAWLVAGVSCAYCVLGGADAPIARATVMIVLYLGAVVCWREPDPLSVLGAAALLVLAVSPGELFNAGFQLSFLAVLALLTVYPALERSWCVWRAGVAPASALAGAALSPPPQSWRERVQEWSRDRLPALVRKALFVSLAAWFGTAPVVAWHMGRFAVFSLLVNLIAVPLSNVCMVCGVAMLICGAISRTAALAAGAAAWASVLGLQALNDIVAAIPCASVDVPPPGLAVMIVFAVVWLWMWIARTGGAASWRLPVVLAAALSLLPLGALRRGEPQPAGVTVLALRYGRAVLVEAPGRAALVDAGAPG
jgi:competence protein ComEC